MLEPVIRAQAHKPARLVGHTNPDKIQLSLVTWHPEFTCITMASNPSAVHWHPKLSSSARLHITS